MAPGNTPLSNITSRLRVLFITEWYPTKNSPVGCNYIREHAKAVNRYDDVILFHMAGADKELHRFWDMREEKDDSMREGIETYCLWYRPSPIPKISYVISLWSVLQAFKRLLGQGFRPDVIHAHVYEAAVAAILIGRLYRIPVVVTEHSSEFPRRRLSRYKVWKARWSFKRADLVMPVSHFLKRSIETHGIKARFLVVPNVVDTGIFFPDSRRTADGVRRLLAVGLLDKAHNKGFPHLFDALARLEKRRQDWHLRIVGDGPGLESCQRMVQSLGLSEKVTFCGLKNKREVAEYMRRCDLFVLPSMVETFSVVSAEALACGVPVVATSCGGPEDFLNGKTGMNVAPGNAEELYRAIDYMLDHLAEFSAAYLSEYAKSLFSAEQIGRTLHEVYLGVAKSRRVAA
jgi:glycosyltransferase involved in cell wall biosynthesis